MPFLSGYDGLELKKYQNSTFPYLVITEEWIRICSQNNRFLQIFNGDYYYCALVHTHILCVVLVHCLDVSPKSTFQTAVFDLFFAVVEALFIATSLSLYIFANRQVSHLAGFALRPTTSPTETRGGKTECEEPSVARSTGCLARTWYRPTSWLQNFKTPNILLMQTISKNRQNFFEDLYRDFYFVEIDWNWKEIGVWSRFVTTSFG